MTCALPAQDSRRVICHNLFHHKRAKPKLLLLLKAIMIDADNYYFLKNLSLVKGDALLFQADTCKNFEDIASSNDEKDDDDCC